jgi:hypothetical protein
MLRRVQSFIALLCFGCLPLSASNIAVAQSFKTELVISGLQKPSGINLDVYGNLYYSEIPTPGTGDGANRVVRLNANRKRSVVVSAGDPNPENISTDLYGNVYWTCESAGVIIRRTQFGTGTQSVLLRNLKSPVGIDVPLFAPGFIFFTQVPTPGVPGTAGGSNDVNVAIQLLRSYFSFPLNMGEPEPVDIAVGLDGTVYWTCRTAGVILMRNTSGEISVVESGLDSPMGLDIDLYGRLYWTEVPTPGVSGTNGGRNRVVRYTPSTDETLVINSGDPEPYDVTVSLFGDEVFWTCRSAGVILRARSTP